MLEEIAFMEAKMFTSKQLMNFQIKLIFQHFSPILIYSELIYSIQRNCEDLKNWNKYTIL